jgi:nitrate/nitrite transporter NarK
VILAKAGYNAVFGLTLGIIGIDIILRLLVIEKAAATNGLARSKEDQGDRIQQDDPEQNRTRKAVKDKEINVETRPVTEKAVEDKEINVETRPVTEKADRRMKIPAILRLLSSRRLCVALLASFTIGLIFAGFETVLPLHTHEAFGWNSEGAGLIFLPLTLPSFLGPLVGWLCDRYGPKWPMAAGFLSLLPILTLLRYAQENTLNQKIILCVLLTLAACCFTLTLNPVMAEVAYVINAKTKANPQAYGGGGAGSGSGSGAYAQAFGLFNTAYSLGNTIGPICAGLIKNAAGWATMGWVLGLIGGLTAVPVGLWSGIEPPTVM